MEPSTYQPTPEEAAIAIGTLAVLIVVALLVVLAINVIVCLLLHTCFKSVPPDHRKMEPGLVWLLLIPLFNLVWNFFVFLRLAESYKSYFDSVGRADVGKSGKAIGLWFVFVPPARTCHV